VLARVLKDAPKLESGKLGASVLAGWGWAGPIPYARGVMDVLLENGAFRLDEGTCSTRVEVGSQGYSTQLAKGRRHHTNRHLPPRGRGRAGVHIPSSRCHHGGTSPAVGLTDSSILLLGSCWG
jgi:hypothetical protein